MGDVHGPTIGEWLVRMQDGKSGSGMLPVLLLLLLLPVLLDG